MGSSGLADDGDGCAWVLQGWGYQVGGGVFVEVQVELLGGKHCWDTRVDRLMDIQVCRRCPGRRLRGRCALFSARCPWDGGAVLTGLLQKPAALLVRGGPCGRRWATGFIVQRWMGWCFGDVVALGNSWFLGLLLSEPTLEARQCSSQGK